MSSRSGNSAQCQVCSTNSSKYTCSKCYIPYCSVSCYKEHQQMVCSSGYNTTPAKPLDEETQVSSSSRPNEAPDPKLETRKPLRPLTSLNWPYVPEESAFPDPLKRNDPKDLQLRHYEAIATSAKIREILAKHENLPALLTSIDKFRGIEREEALQKALEVTPRDLDNWNGPHELNEDVLALRELAEAVEAAIRGDNQRALGLDWGE